MSSPGGAGLHVQSDCGDRSSDDAQGLRYSRMGGQLGPHHVSRVHEVLQRCSSRGNSALAVKAETNVELKHKHKWEPILSRTVKLHVHKLKKLCVLLGLLCFFQKVFELHNQKTAEELVVMKVAAFVSTQMHLSPETFKRFWNHLIGS